jgi:hypothetical protein
MFPTPESIQAYCMTEAVASALDEAKATPIEIGKQVGHTDFATYGTKSGKLQGYEGDEAIVKNEAGDEWKWKTEGMVDVDRVYEFTDQYQQRISKLLFMIELGEMMGVPATETLNKVLGPPNPNCPCEFCTAQRAAAGTDGATQIATAEGTETGGGAPEETATANTDANRFPFDDFLAAVNGNNGTN